MSMQTISIMDYIGTFAFALSGAYLAIRYELDIFGIFVCAFSTACGGGITRDVVMNMGVPRFFSSYTTIMIVIVASLLAIATKSEKWSKLMLTADAIAWQSLLLIRESEGWTMDTICPRLVFVSVITAVGGGVIRDILLQRVPIVLRKEVYASAALAGAVVLWFIYPIMDKMVATYISLAVVFGIRMWSVYKHIDLPVVHLDTSESAQ